MNSTGRLFRVSLYGESHGPAVGIVLDGVPAGILLSAEDFAIDLTRRKPGRPGTTTRIEDDIPIILSGVYQGKTTGAPLHISFENKNIRSADYISLIEQPRPGHADFTSRVKFSGFNDPRGGGHFSGRLTLCLVAAGVVAKKCIPEITFQSHVAEAGGMTDIESALEEALKKGDSIGGVVECIVSQIPVGIGEPFFDSLESVIAHLAFSIPAVKGIEFGSGFAASRMTGSQHNDAFVTKEGKTKTNHSGGISGGLSNGNDLVVRLAVKPTSSTPQAQRSLNFLSGEMENLQIQGRHDLCIALRVPVVLEAIIAIGLADLCLIHGKSR
ncbi:MAG: chorismate synthase [Saprospiraceae bacterium]